MIDPIDMSGSRLSHKLSLYAMYYSLIINYRQVVALEEFFLFAPAYGTQEQMMRFIRHFRVKSYKEIL